MTTDPVQAIREKHPSALPTDDEISAAIDAYLNGTSAGPPTFDSSYRIDVARAIEMHPYIAERLADPANRDLPRWRRALVRSAILLSFQEG